MTKRPTIAVLGGGLSGALVCAALARAAQVPLDILLAEPRASPGQGLAYAPSDDGFLVNVPAARLRAFPDRPGDFPAWLAASGASLPPVEPDGGHYPPRQLFGRYLTERVAADIAAARGTVRLRHRRYRAVALGIAAGGLKVTFADGGVAPVAGAVLAFGNPPPRPLARLLPAVSPAARIVDDAWAPGALATVARDAAVLVVGTGLTMADMVVALRARGHAGRIVAVSRHGLVPHVARQVPDPRPDAMAGHPTGASAFTRMLRQAARQAERDTGDWLRAVEELRVAFPTVWAALEPAARDRLRRHARPWWDIHRYRMPPATHRVLQAALADGTLQIRAGRIRRIAAGAASVETGGRLTVVEADVVLNCTGPDLEYRDHPEPLLDGVWRDGLGQRTRDGAPLLDAEDALIPAPGMGPSRVLLAGPMARSRYGELTTVTEIGRQAERLARTALRWLDT